MTERERRWRMVLGDDAPAQPLDPADVLRDRALGALYAPTERGGLGPSMPSVATWLGAIREAFPQSVVQIMQRDALDRLGLVQMLLQPETLAQVVPDVRLAATLITLSRALPDQAKAAARQVVAQVVRDLEARLRDATVAQVRGALRARERTRRPRPGEMDWPATVRANLRNYRPEIGTIVPEVWIGSRRSAGCLGEVVVLMDQSGSMAGSVIHSGVLASVLASVRALRTSVVAFDTEVVDLSALLADPVELLLATRLGGGTDIGQAVAYGASLVRQPSTAVVLLISDLIDGGAPGAAVRGVARMVEDGVRVVALLALDDAGHPVYDATMAGQLAGLGVPVFACTPDLFPELMAAALRRQDLGLWAAGRGVELVG